MTHDTTTAGLAEGWAPAPKARVYHYFAHARSLCGRHEQDGPIYPADQNPAPNNRDCKECARLARQRLTPKQQPLPLDA